MGNAMTKALGLQRALATTPHECGACGEEHAHSDSIAMLQIVVPYTAHPPGAREWTVLFEELKEEDGDFTYPPYFFHTACWVEHQEELAEMLQESRDEYESSPTALCSCSFCRAPIEEGEIMGTAHCGDFVLADQQPDGMDTLSVRLDGDPQVLCLQCLFIFNSQVIEGLYEEDSFVCDDEAGEEAPGAQWVSE